MSLSVIRYLLRYMRAEQSGREIVDNKGESRERVCLLRENKSIT